MDAYSDLLTSVTFRLGVFPPRVLMRGLRGKATAAANPLGLSFMSLEAFCEGFVRNSRAFVLVQGSSLQVPVSRPSADG